MLPDNLIVFLKEIELFQDLTNEEHEKLSKHVRFEAYADNDKLFEENTERTDLFIIYTGQIELFKKNQFGKN